MEISLRAAKAKALPGYHETVVKVRRRAQLDAARQSRAIPQARVS